MFQRIYLILIFLTFAVSSIVAAIWTDDFEGADLDRGWTFQDRPGDPTTLELNDGELWMTHVPDGFGHLVAERPVLYRDAPKGDFSIYGFFNSEPEENYGAWIGLFIGDPFSADGGASDYAFLGFGGEAGAIKLILLGSGKPAAPSPLPFWLKIEKSGNDYNAFTREAEGDDWQNVGKLVRELKDSKVGIGMLNHWDGTTLTLITDSFHMEGENVKSSAVSYNGKLTATWGELKANQR